MCDLVITGGAGFLGMNLLEYFEKELQTKIVDINPPKISLTEDSWVQADIKDEKNLFAIINILQPRVVIHAAGIKDVQYCETHPEEAYQVNAIGTRNVAQACNNIGAKMIYISTDWVFAGDAGNYLEKETPKPTSVYGKTKLMGEKLASDILIDLAICRSGGIYGKRSPLLIWIKNQLDQGRTIDCYTDIYNSPTYVINLAEHIKSIIKRDLRGTFHIVGKQRVNRYQFFNTYAKVFGYNQNLIKETTYNEQSKNQSLLLHDISLSIEFTSSILGGYFNSIEEGFIRMKAQGGIG